MDVSTAGIFTAASLDRPGMTCIAVIAHDWLCLRSDVSTTSHLILHWVLLLEQPDKTLAWSMDLDLCIVFGDSCRSPGFQALQDIQELHSASHLACLTTSSCPPREGRALTLLTLVCTNIKINEKQPNSQKAGASIKQAAALSCLQAQACQLLWTTCSFIQR